MSKVLPFLSEGPKDVSGLSIGEALNLFYDGHLDQEELETVIRVYYGESLEQC